jgi:hypothetical protein
MGAEKVSPTIITDSSEFLEKSERGLLGESKGMFECRKTSSGDPGCDFRGFTGDVGSNKFVETGDLG